MLSPDSDCLDLVQFNLAHFQTFIKNGKQQLNEKLQVLLTIIEVMT